MGDLLAVRPEEFTMPAAKYERVAEAIREQIRSGELKAGDKLPSLTQLEQIHGVSYGSIRTAMLILKTEGLIEGRAGDGVYVK